MPIPKKKKGESNNDFISRCMSSEVMKSEFPNEEQRLAVCNSRLQLSRTKKKKKGKKDGES